MLRFSPDLWERFGPAIRTRNVQPSEASLKWLKEADALEREIAEAVASTGLVRIARVWGRLKTKIELREQDAVYLYRFTRHMGEFRKNRSTPFRQSILESLLQLKDWRSIGRLQEDNEEEQTETHSALVNAFKKAFGIKVEKTEPVSTGVYVYLDRDNTLAINRQLKTGREVQDFAMKHEYHCVRHGNMSDLTTGHFGEQLSRWIFIDVEPKATN